MVSKLCLKIFIHDKKQLIILLLLVLSFINTKNVFSQINSPIEQPNIPVVTKVQIYHKDHNDVDLNKNDLNDVDKKKDSQNSFLEKVNWWLALLASIVTVIASIEIRSLLIWYKNFRKNIEEAKASAETSLSNLIFSADIALMSLPDMTSYTQQIPPKTVKDLEFLSKKFSSKTDEGKKLWEKLNLEENGTRIYVAKALNLLGKKACDRRYIIKMNSCVRKDTKSEDKNEEKERDYESVVGLLSSALDSVDEEDVSLRITIFIRLVQALRQIGEYDTAKSILVDLKELDKGGTNPSARIIGMWGEAVLNLQLGMAMSIRFENNIIISQAYKEQLKEKRRNYFSEAVVIMDDVYRNVFGWEFNGTYANPRYYRFRNDRNLAYYAAKALWTYYLTYSKESAGYRKDTIVEYDKKLKEALYKALLLFNEKRLEYIEEPCIAAIYNYCVALILTIREALTCVDNLNIVIAPGETDIAKKDFGEFSGDVVRWRGIRDECIEISEDKLKEICHLNLPIYVENTECLNSTNIFQEGIDMLKKIAAETSDAKKYELFSDFYSFGKVP